MIDQLKECTLCPRECKVDRAHGAVGFCGCNDKLKIARAALHFWEEPCLSGDRGSGAVFFSGCGLGCVFCQNYDISAKCFGKEIAPHALAQIFLRLQAQGAFNINLVTPTQYVYQIIEALEIARKSGMDLPVIYNTSGYEKKQTIELLKGYVDVYLPDFKYICSDFAGKYSNAPDYPQVVKIALEAMVNQVGPCVFDDNGIIQKGVIVRHLILPGTTVQSKKIIEYLYKKYGDSIFISIMNQYTPFGKIENYRELQRKITKKEYDCVLNYALDLGIENGFIQEGGTAKESFIPPFDLTGVEDVHCQNENDKNNPQ
ncbi:MAG: radical SAM protein [Oscillospiraceae bacterium]